MFPLEVDHSVSRFPWGGFPNPTASYAHRLLSIFLLERGVVDQAMNEAKQAIAIDGSDGLSFGALASALLRAQRWTEAETAARSAIRLTDGAHSAHHFALGSALFELQRWGEAKNAYEQAAKMSPKDSASTYNIALSLMRMGFDIVAPSSQHSRPF